VSSQFHYTKRNRFMPFLLAEILNFQGSTHRIGVGSFSKYFDEVNEEPVVYHWKYRLDEIDPSEKVVVDTLPIKKSS
ncbi:hypothetical protein ACTQ25_14295, partial [Fusicatenibacter saccharivorans]